MLPSLRASTYSDAELSIFQGAAPVPLPPSLMAHIAGPIVECDLEWAEISIPGNTDTQSWRRLLSDDGLRQIGLVQVALGPSGDPVCIDICEAGEDHEYPVVVINHDCVPDEDWSSPEAIRKWVYARFGSFLELLKAICCGCSEGGWPVL